MEEEDERLAGLSEIIKKHGVIPEEDLTSLHAILYQIWQSLPKGIRSSTASFAPENVFNS